MWKILVCLVILLQISISERHLPPNHLRHIFYYEYSRGSTEAETARNISDLYGPGTTSERTCQEWFQRFREGLTELEDQPRSGRPSELDDQALISLINEDIRQSTRDFAEQLGTNHTAVEKHLRALGYKKKYGAWIPHHLKDADKWQRMSVIYRMSSNVRANLLSCYHRKSFLPRLVTGDEKWIFHANFRRRKQWVGPGEKTK